MKVRDFHSMDGHAARQSGRLSMMEPYCGKTSLAKDFHSNENWHMWVRILPR